MVKDDVIILRKKGENIKEYNSEIKLDNVNLPIKKGDKVGVLLVKDNKNIIKKIDLISNDYADKRNFFELWINIFKSVFTGDLNS